MRLYRTAAGRWAGTQADAARLAAGGSWDQIEVPTDKPGLLAWLDAQPTPAAPAANQLALPAPAATEAACITTPMHAPPIGRDFCPKCTRTPRAAETLAKGDDVEAIGAWLWQAEPWQLERLFAVLGHRVGELAR